jgi:hypothetical protein
MLEKEVEKEALRDTPPVHTSLEKKMSSDTEVDEFLVMMEQEVGSVGGDDLPESTSSSSMQSDLKVVNKNVK